MLVQQGFWDIERAGVSENTVFAVQCHHPGATRESLIYIDDLCKGRWTQLTEAFWFDLVEARTSNCRPIIVTTNYKGDELEEKPEATQLKFTIRCRREFCDVITLD